MAKWEELFNELGDEGKSIAKDLKSTLKQIDDDLSTFLQAEAVHIKSHLKLYADGKIDKDDLETALRGEQRLIRQHADTIASGTQAKLERDVTNALLKVVVKTITIVLA